MIIRTTTTTGTTTGTTLISPAADRGAKGRRREARLPTSLGDSRTVLRRPRDPRARSLKPPQCPQLLTGHGRYAARRADSSPRLLPGETN